MIFLLFYHLGGCFGSGAGLTGTIESSARTFCKEVFYLNRKELSQWAAKAINSLRTARSNFHEEGDSEWRRKIKDLFILDKTTPKAFIELISRKKLSDL